MNENITLKRTWLTFLPSAFQSIHNVCIQVIKAMHDYQIALIETKQKHWPDISIVLPANITIKGVTFTKSKTQNGKRVYGNKDTRWHYRKSSFYIPFYHSILNLTSISNRYIVKPVRTKINRNIRPKGTHSHFKFYR